MPRYWAPLSLGAAGALAIGVIAFEHRATPPAPPATPVAPKAAEPPSSAPPIPPPVQTSPAPQPEPPKPAAASGLVVTGGIQPVLPNVPDKARLTIHGKVRVSIRVETDSAGLVTSATPQSGTSKYFVDLALKAARQWRFPPGPAGRAWTIRFVFTREADHSVSAESAPAAP